jgi:hypothetical protein
VAPKKFVMKRKKKEKENVVLFDYSKTTKRARETF